jgi:L-aspartate oxidase
MNKVSTDFLVIGSGVAGLSAAIKLSAYGQVTVLTKSALNECSTALAQGGIAVALAKTDTPQSHLEDTINAGAGLCERSAVEVLVAEGPERVRELIGWGLVFDKASNGELAFGMEAAHSCSRILHVGDSTGASLHEVLLNKAKSIESIELIENTMVTKLISNGEVCAGAITDQGIAYLSCSVLLATGGIGQIYKNTSNPLAMQGDGLVLAYEAGAELMDLEFIQFHPTGFLLPTHDNKLFLISEAVRGEGALLRNVFRQRFVDELAPRDVVTRAVFEEMHKTNSTHVLLDMAPIKHAVQDRFPSIYRVCREAKINMTKDLVPVAPLAHYHMGGIRVNLQAETSLRNLYAAGEAACTGVDGANRLASNSLLAGLVFSHRAVQQMIKNQQVKIAPAQELAKENKYSYNNPSILFQVKEILWNYVGIKRTKENLLLAAGLLANMPAEESVVILAKLITESALIREESRGAHYRDDFQNISANWEARIVLTKGKGYAKASIQK